MKACIACKFFELSLGSEWMADTAPGTPGSCSCAKRHFSYGGDDDINPVRDFVEQAQQCPDYALSDEARAVGWEAG